MRQNQPKNGNSFRENIDLIVHANAQSDGNYLIETEFAKKYGFSWREGSPLFWSFQCLDSETQDLIAFAPVLTQLDRTPVFGTEGQKMLQNKITN